MLTVVQYESGVVDIHISTNIVGGAHHRTLILQRVGGFKLTKKR